MRMTESDKQAGDAAPATPSSTDIPTPSDPLAGARLLLAEDHEASAKILRFRLERAGAQIDLARNGQEVVELFQKSGQESIAYDAVLMDMQMPIIDGYEATRILRSLDYRGPIIAVTAASQPDEKEEILRLGCDACITKPVDWNALFSLLRQLRAVPERS